MAKKTGPRVAGDTDIDLGKRIRQRRTEFGMTQTDLGKKLGVSFQQVQKYEKGSNRVPASRLRQIAGVLEMPMAEFYEPDKKFSGVDTLIGKYDDKTLRFLRAYSRLGNRDLQHRIVELIEAIADRYG